MSYGMCVEVRDQLLGVIFLVPSIMLGLNLGANVIGVFSRHLYLLCHVTAPP